MARYMPAKTVALGPWQIIMHCLHISTGNQFTKTTKQTLDYYELTTFSLKSMLAALFFKHKIYNVVLKN